MRVTDEWWLDEEGRQVIGEQGLVELTALGFRLLRYFLAHDGAVLSRAQLLEAVWGPDYTGSDRAVDEQVYLLRRRLEPDPAQPRYVRTRRGAGYQYWGPRHCPRPKRDAG